MTQAPHSTVLHVAGIGRGVSMPPRPRITIIIDEAQEMLKPTDMDRHRWGRGRSS
jgi:hypothetical protein